MASTSKKKRRKHRGRGKGPKFERTFATRLSQWWTDGRRDDIFWRSAGSGNRATKRARGNRSTYNSFGDISATDPLGEAFTDVFVVSLKTGYYKIHAVELLDKPNKRLKSQFGKWLDDVDECWQKSGSLSWILVHQRTGRAAVVYMPRRLYIQIANMIGQAALAWVALYDVRNRFDIVCVRLDQFLLKVKPFHIERISQGRRR